MTNRIGRRGAFLLIAASVWALQELSARVAELEAS